MRESEKDIASRRKLCRDVTTEECYMGGHCCATCMYRADHDSEWSAFENDYCTVSTVDAYIAK